MEKKADRFTVSVSGDCPKCGQFISIEMPVAQTASTEPHPAVTKTDEKKAAPPKKDPTSVEDPSDRKRKDLIQKLEKMILDDEWGVYQRIVNQVQASHGGVWTSYGLAVLQDIEKKFEEGTKQIEAKEQNLKKKKDKEKEAPNPEDF